MVAQATGMDPRWNEIVAEGVHIEQRGGLGHITKIIGQFAHGKRGTGGRLDTHKTDFLTVKIVREVRGCKTGEVGTTATAADDDIRIISGNLHLLFGLKADNGLVENDMVEYGTEGVLGVFAGEGIFDGLGDGDAKRSGGVREFCPDLAADIGVFAGA